MSKRSRRGNDYAPSTFPFLAVLLCVIGALVLLLVINVANSRASARNQVQSELTEAIEEAKERSDYLVSISEELQARRQQVGKQIELRRSELARAEDHIERLEKDLLEAQARLEKLEDMQESSELKANDPARIQELKDQIEAQKLRLAEAIAERKDQTPAFSIIPYEGANRTTRRPVYLECTAQGVVIQPEGVLVSIEDLGPPHGPGNPLDAALRVLRNAYQSRDAIYGITIPPYPLLLVRPEGIASYALARSAMSGWDDQFGYELIDAQMELAFPDGIPELKTDLVRALGVAKDRQRALVAALPAKYSRNPFATKTEETWDSIDADLARGANRSESIARGSQVGKDSGIEQDRRWEMIEQLPASSPGRSDSNGSSSGLMPAGKELGSGGSGVGSTVEAETSTAQGDGSRGDRSGSEGTGSEGTGSEGTQGGGSQVEGSMSPTSGGARSSSNRFSASSSGSSGGSASLEQSPEDEQMQRAMQEQAIKQQAGESLPGSRASSASSASAGESKKKTSGADSDLKPISLTAGKDWATSRMDNRSTPVSRPIRIIVLQDRWLMCSEGQDWKYDAEISLEQGPQAASAELQESIRDRVESWGLSLPGGYWVPSLSVQAAADAEQSLLRMQRLLEGSGVIIKVQPLTTPKNRK
ncbi:MAG: hypothetical protein DWH99_04155 [Planctomycetota bacterium]|nr:MAG: hypothetical protein DWH99_04155 [Planctomycetota bacterium]